MPMNLSEIARAKQRERAEVALDHMQQGLVMLTAEQQVRVFNARAPELLNLPIEVLHPGAAFADIRAFQRRRGDFALVPEPIEGAVAGSDLRLLPSAYEWPRPDGTTLEVRGARMPDDGFVYTFTDVTPRKLTEAALKATEASYRLLVEGVSDHAIYMLSPSGHVRNWNAGAERIKGYTAEEIVGQHFSFFYTDDDRQLNVPAGALRTAETLGVFKDEGWRVRKSGERFWANVVIHPIRNESGSLLGFTKITQDATQRWAAEKALRASEARHRLLAENTTDIIVQGDLDTTLRYVSPASAAVLGYGPDDMTDRRLIDFVHGDDTEAFQGRFEDLTHRRSERFLGQYRHRHKDGRYVWIEISCALTRDGANSLPAGYVASLRDISARKAAEIAVADSDARYREALDRAHDAILAQIAEGVIVTDAAGRITLVNEAAAAIHGVARLDIEPSAYSETYHLYTEDGHPYATQDLPLARAVRGETVPDARWRVRRPDGTEVLAIGSARPVLSRNGRQIGAVLTLRDDTAREAAERSLRVSEAALRELNASLSERVTQRTHEAEAARQEAERASAAKTDFLASMSHEIRTPLNSILGFAGLIQDDPTLSPTTRRHTEIVQTSGEALLTVVNDILDFSKVEAGAIELEPRAFSVADLSETSVAIVQGTATKKLLGIRTSVDPDLPSVLVGDEGRLRQVLLNFLNNAVKFTPNGFVTLNIRQEGHTPEGTRVRFSVADTGIGIPREKQDRLPPLYG